MLSKRLLAAAGYCEDDCEHEASSMEDSCLGFLDNFAASLPA